MCLESVNQQYSTCYKNPLSDTNTDTVGLIASNKKKKRGGMKSETDHFLSLGKMQQVPDLIWNKDLH